MTNIKPGYTFSTGKARIREVAENSHDRNTSSRLLPRELDRESTMTEPTKILAITQVEADLILDAMRVSNPLTRGLALKVAGLVLEFAAEDDVRRAVEYTSQATCVGVGQADRTL